MGQVKSYYGDGGTFYAMFIAAKVKYRLVIEEQGKTQRQKNLKHFKMQRFSWILNYIFIYYKVKQS